MPRPRGTGSIYQRKGTGRWESAIVLPDGTRRTFYGWSREEVEDKLRAAGVLVAQQLPIPSAKETVKTFLERWLADVASQRVRTTTLTRYKIDVDQRLVPALGKLKLSELTPQRVQAMLAGLTKQGLSPRSVAHCRAVLRVALEQAQREGLVGRNVAKLATVPRKDDEPVAALTPEMARRVIAAFENHDLQPLVILALATGLRQGELLGLGWDDVQLDAGTIRVRQQLQRIGGAYELVELKTRHSRRTLAVPPVGVAALRRQQERQAEWRRVTGPKWIETGRVFTTPYGDYLNGPSTTHIFAKRLVAAGLPAMRFHDLRHGAASLLLAQGADIRRIMEQLGHSQIAVTANTYAHISAEVMRENANLLEGVLGSEG